MNCQDQSVTIQQTGWKKKNTFSEWVYVMSLNCSIKSVCSLRPGFLGAAFDEAVN